jgi:hypothetical protein
MLSRSGTSAPEKFDVTAECKLASKKSASNPKKTLKGGKKIGNNKLMGVMVPD